MRKTTSESGNIIFFILLAIVLVGLVTAALRSGGIEGANIDREDMVIKVAQVRQNAAELERAVTLVMQNGISEVEISFAADHPSAAAYGTYNDNPRAEVFNPKGGGAIWRKPPSGVNDGSFWEFYGTTAAPGIGTDRADVIAVLPNVVKPFCEAVNKINGQSETTIPTDDASCISGGTVFVGLTPPNSTPNPFNDPGSPMTENDFRQGPDSVAPAGQACVSCGGVYHFYHVLLSR